MKWYHFSVEYFEDLRNVNHCEFLIMRKKEDSGKYILENHLRTWSELRRERQAAAASSKPLTLNTTEKEKEKERKLLGGVEPAAAASPSSPAIPVRKKWGGCPNGCDHSKHSYSKKGDHPMSSSNSTKASSPIIKETNDVLPFRRSNTARRWQSSEDEDEDDPRGRLGPPKPVDVQLSLDEVVSSPDGTPSFISVDDRLRLKSPKVEPSSKSTKQDFQGGSDTEFSPAEQKLRSKRPSGTKKKGTNGVEKRKGREESGMGRGAMADALGDQSDADTGGSDADLDIRKIKSLEEEEEEKSVRGSVY